MDLLRGKAARRVVIGTVITLTLALPTAYSQTSPTSDKPAASAATDADINAFLSTLDKKAVAPVGSPAVAQQSPAMVAPEPSAEIRTALIVDDASPFRTLFLMIGGVIVCALATVGLTLTFFALRKEMNRRKRGHRRPSSSSSAVHAAHR